MSENHTPTPKPCPFCRGKAEIVHIEEGENAGGSCVCCTQCMASSNVEFEFKENFVSNWNRRADDDSHEALVEAATNALDNLDGIAQGNDIPSMVIRAALHAALSQARA